MCDNIASLKCAIAGDHPLALPSLLGETITCEAYTAHTIQLVVADVKSFADTLFGLVSWISQIKSTF